MAATITRERGCFYYKPWLATASICLAVAGLGVWAHYTKSARRGTEDALAFLDSKINVNARNIDRINPALIATAITYMVFAFAIYVLSWARSSIEAGHDATGITGGSATTFLTVSFLVSTAWWVIMAWVVLVGMGDALWAAMVYIFKKAIEIAIEYTLIYGYETFHPSTGCPGQCLNLRQFAFIMSEFEAACVCHLDKLGHAQLALENVYKDMAGVMVGIWLMLLAGGWLLVNLACQFAHTKRERELLQRLVEKVENAYVL